MKEQKRIFRQLSLLIIIFICGVGLGNAQTQIPGRLDPTFGVNGKVTTAISTSNSCYDVKVQTDGKIVCVGDSYDPNGNFASRFAIVRYNSDGSLDTTFSADGISFVGFDTKTAINQSTAQSVAIQADGKLVIAGHTIISNSFYFALARLNTDGSLDTGFGDDGKVLTQIGVDSLAQSVKLQTDGKIVAVGFISNGSNQDFAVARYNPDGSLDTTFDDDGKLSTAVTAGSDYAFDVAIQTDGKILVCGNGIVDTAIVRYNTDGTLDTSFSSNGKSVISVGVGESRANTMALQKDGKIVVAGRAKTSVGGYAMFFVGRFDTNGTLDTSFGENGKVITKMGEVGSGIAESVVIQSNGKIIVAGHSQPIAHDNFAIARLNTDGSFDTSFGSDGKVLTPFSDYALGYASTIQPDGKLVVVGRRLLNGQFDIALARYYSECSVPNSCFETTVSGKVLTSEMNPVRNAIITTVTSNGEIKYAMTNPFGYFRFSNLVVGDTYTFNVSAKGKTFQPVTIKLMQENINSINFIANP